MDLTSLANNVMAAMSMANVIRTTMGPKGLDKLLVDQLGNRVITNDGYTVLVSLRTTHPVGRLLVEIAELQEISVGDGTTTAVVIAAEMLKEGYRIVSEYNIHPSKIIKELDEGVSITEDFLEKSSIELDQSNQELMLNVLRTATAAKLDGEQISDLIMKAINLLWRIKRTDLRHGIILLRRLGEDFFIEGIAIEHLPQEKSFVDEINEPRVCLIKDSLKFPLAGQPIEGDNERYDKERNLFVSTLIDEDVNIVITNASQIDQALRLDLTLKKIALIRVSTEELELLSKALKIPTMYGAHIITDMALSYSSLDGVELDEDKGLTIFKNPGSGVVATLIMGGATNETSKERMRTCTDGVSAVHFALKGGLVAGGGIAELNAARHLQKMMVERGVEKPGWNVLIKGLESIPRQILENSGYNGYEMTLKLKSEPDEMGINVENGELVNMVKAGIIDPLITKINAIRIASHITKTILKIDRNLLKEEIGKEVSSTS